MQVERVSMSGQGLAQRHHDVGMTQAGPSRPPRGCFHAEEAGCRQDPLSTSILAPPPSRLHLQQTQKLAHRSPHYNSRLSCPACLQGHSRQSPQRPLGCPQIAKLLGSVPSPSALTSAMGVAGFIRGSFLPGLQEVASLGIPALADPTGSSVSSHLCICGAADAGGLEPSLWKDRPGCCG